MIVIAIGEFLHYSENALVGVCSEYCKNFHETLTALALNVQILHSELLPRHPRPHLSVPAGQGAAQQRAVRGGAARGGVHPPPRARHHPLHGHRGRGRGDNQVPPGPVLQVGAHHQEGHSSSF